jgi:hypothetical protein
MLKNENIDKKVRAYIDNLFSGVGTSQQLFDLKEELATNIKEKIFDIKSRGLDDEQAFKEAIISMGDLKGLVDDMRKLGQDIAKQNVYSTMTFPYFNRRHCCRSFADAIWDIDGISMLYFMRLEPVAVTGSGVFIIAGGALFTYSLLTRETSKKYAMNKIRAALYALAIGLILFSIFVAVTSYFATGEMFIAIGGLMVFLLAGIGLFLILVLTGTDRHKN